MIDKKDNDAYSFSLVNRYTVSITVINFSDTFSPDVKYCPKILNPTIPVYS